MRRTVRELKGLGVDWIQIHPYAGIRRDGTVRFARAREDPAAEERDQPDDGGQPGGEERSDGEPLRREPGSEGRRELRGQRPTPAIAVHRLRVKRRSSAPIQAPATARVSPTAARRGTKARV